MSHMIQCPCLNQRRRRVLAARPQAVAAARSRAPHAVDAAHPQVVEAALVGVQHGVEGAALYVFVALTQGAEAEAKPAK